MIDDTIYLMCHAVLYNVTYYDNDKFYDALDLRMMWRDIFVKIDCDTI